MKAQTNSKCAEVNKNILLIDFLFLSPFQLLRCCMITPLTVLATKLSVSKTRHSL